MTKRRPVVESVQPDGEQRPLRLAGALRRAWLGYQLRVDEGLAAEGFDDRGYPDGRVLRICATNPAGTTISQIGRELYHAPRRKQDRRRPARTTVRDGRSVPDERQGEDRDAHPARDRLPRCPPQHTAGDRAAGQAELGPEACAALGRLLEALRADDDVRLDDYLRKMAQASGLRHPDDWLPAPDASPRDQRPNRPAHDHRARHRRP